MKENKKMTNAHSAIIRDWTKETLILDIVNSIGEKYHFEIEPDAEDNIPTRRASVNVKMLIPVAVQLDMFTK